MTSSVGWRCEEGVRIVIYERDDQDTVDPQDGCPRCGEREIDRLIWIKDATRVWCWTCGRVYVPPQQRYRGGEGEGGDTYDPSTR